jgi:hypothetical protein
MLTFPYLQKDRQYFPVVDVSLGGVGRSLTLKALVDSGASFSVFRAEVLEYLGLPLVKGERVYLEGIGGRILGYRHRLPVVVGTTAFALTIVFSQELAVSFNLLGRDNFFQRFLVTFNERGRLVQLRSYRE